MKRRLLSMVICLLMIVSLVPAAALADDMTITSIAATITAPEPGKTPDEMPTSLTSTPADGVKHSSVAWKKLAKDKDPDTTKVEDWTFLNENEAFDVNHYYMVFIYAAPKTGFTIDKDFSGTVNGQPCKAGVIPALNQAYLSCVFKDVQPATITKVNMVIPEPKLGEKLSFEPAYESEPADSVETLRRDDGTLFVIWWKAAAGEYEKVDPNKGEEFQPGYYYEVSVVAVPKAGYRLVAQTELTVNGKKPHTSDANTATNDYSFRQIFEPIAPVPGYPTTDNISGLGDKLVAVLCSNAPSGKGGGYYGLLDGGFTYTSGPTLVNGVYECTIKLVPSVYCNQYSTDSRIKHEADSSFVLNTSDPSIVLQYNSKTMMWTPKDDPETIIFGVKCDEHVVEYTVSFDKNGGTGMMDSVMVEEGSQYTLPECKLTAPAGKVFKAWSVNGTEKSVGDKITVNADTTVTAVWKVKLTPYVPGHTHSYTKAVTAPTCTDKGYTTYTCSCGNSYVSDYVNANGHTEVVDAAVAATCEKTGLTEGKHCSVCNAVLTAQKETPKAAHSFDKGFCSVCGAVDASYVPFKDVKEGDAFYDDIMWAWKNHIIVGDENGNYNADDDLTRAQVVTMLWRMSGSPKAEKAAGFSDLTQDWYKEAVAWAVEKGIVKGIGNNLFDPDGTCTRAMFVTMLWRLNGFETAENAAPFTDLTQDWYKAAVAWASSNGVTKGTSSTTFSPDDNCTRGQAAAFLHRLAQLEK